MSLKSNLIFFVLLLFSCQANPPSEKNQRILRPDFQKILDENLLKGAILIYDASAECYYSNDFERAALGKLPASTYKIPHSIIALETGLVEDDRTIFPWDGEARYLDIWERDMNFREAFQLSCVPCYQGVARRIGSQRMNEYLDRIGYSGMQVDSSNIDQFWLQGESGISCFSQIDFLRRLEASELPVSQRSIQLVKKMMLIEEKEEYILRGKTGWSQWQGVENGWFVGYLNQGKEKYFFATNLEPEKGFDMKKFAQIRRKITELALSSLEIL